MKKRRVLEASKPAVNAGPHKSGADVHGSRPGDVVGDLEVLHAETLSEMRTLSLRLNILARLSVRTAGVLAELHGRKSSTLLCRALRLENQGLSLPRRPGKKG